MTEQAAALPDLSSRIIGIDSLPASQLIANPKNFRTHPKAQKSALAGSLESLGWIDTVLVNKSTGFVIDGHARIVEALRHGENTPVPVLYVDLTPAEEMQALISLDPIAAMAEQDKEMLTEVLQGIDSDDSRVQQFINDLAAREGIDLSNGEQPPDDPGPEIEKADELREKWQTASGQLWQLGSNRLMCGDCTDPATVALIMAGDHAELTFTSPPYWVGKDYEYQNTLQEIREFIQKCAESMAAATSQNGGRIIVNCSTASARAINDKADAETIFTLAWWQEAFRGLNWLMRHCRVWLKNGDMAAPSVAARSDVIDQHWETIPEFLPTFYFPDGLRRGQEKIGMKWAQLGIWTDIQGDRGSNNTHIAAFPLELPERYLRLYTKENEIVFDPFVGSGTTLIACERLGRNCRAIEIDPKYIGVTLERWSQMTGQQPTLIG